MDVELLTTSEAVRHVRNRLMNDWVIICGDMNSIRAIEHAVYTPGTPKNADFEIIGFLPSIHLGKKTKELKELVGDPMENGVVIDLVAERWGISGAVLSEYNPEIITKARAIRDVLSWVRSVLTPGKRGRW